MYKYILETAGNINWMGVFSLLTFVFVFTSALILILRSDKRHFNHMSELPLEDDSLFQAKNQNQ